MAQIQRKFIADDAINGTKLKLDNNQYIRARNAADDADINLLRLNASNELEFASTPKIGGNDVATVNQIPTTFRLQGNWNASTNTPTLASGVNPIDPLDYPMYIVTVAGTTTLDGFTNWEVGDKAYFANGQWYKADNVDPASTDQVTEGATNLYFTEARVLATELTGFTSGPDAAVAATDTVLEGLQKLQAQIAATTGEQALTESFVLSATDITNQYVTLSNAASKLHTVAFGGVVQTPTTDYSLGTSPNNNRVLFAGDIAALAASGDVLVVTYTLE